jgi:hypothetical protein
MPVRNGRPFICPCGREVEAFPSTVCDLCGKAYRFFRGPIPALCGRCICRQQREIEIRATKGRPITGADPIGMLHGDD